MLGQLLGPSLFLPYVLLGLLGDHVVIAYSLGFHSSCYFEFTFTISSLWPFHYMRQVRL